MEMGVDLERFLQLVPSLFPVSQTFGDHSGVKQQERIPRSEVHCLLTRLGGLFQLAVLVESPCQHIPCVNVPANFKFFLCEIEGLGELHIMIGIEQCQIAVVKDLIDVPEQSNVFDQRILFLSFWLTSRLCIEIPELRNKDGHWDNGNGLLIQNDRFRISPVVCPESGERSQSAIVTGMRVECCKVSRIGRSGVTSLRIKLSQLVVQPSKILTRELSFKIGRASCRER